MTQDRRIDIRAREQYEQEKKWATQMMLGNDHFFRLTRNRRLTAREGRIFVAWERQNGDAQIRALFRVSEITLSTTEGVRILLDVSTPNDSYQMALSHRPRRAAPLDLYLWVPAFNGMRYTPLNYSNPLGPRLLHIDLVSRTAGNPDTDHQDGVLCLETVEEFSKRWPQHAFK